MRLARAGLMIAALAAAQDPRTVVAADGNVPAAAKVPPAENLNYHVEWRLIHAGNARLNWKAAGGGWETGLQLESVGLVSRLYKVNNFYTSHLNDRLCIERSLMETSEGSKRRETTVVFDSAKLKAKYTERDLVKNTVADSHELDIRACEHDVVGALYRLRTLNVPLGQSIQIPISDGKKTVVGRIDAQERETVKIGKTKHNTIRYEAHLFNGVLYRRRGRLLVWLTDDDRRLPVQLRVRLPFYIGTVTLQLQEGTAK
jgi:hypothetical protein